jgi:hypothetical protein
MSSRQEEKERRRQERLAAEAAAAAAEKRRRRLGMVGGGVLAVAAVAAIVVSVTAGGGSSKSTKAPSAGVLQAKAQAAGCTVRTFPSEGRTHTTEKVNYKTNPPTSGNHYPTPASDGIYDPGSTPLIGKLVHALEHGRVEYQYKKGSPPAVRAQLEALIKKPGIDNRPGGYNQLLYENTTNMPYEVAATAWTHMIACPKLSGAKTIDALSAFRDQYTDKAPELIQQPE